MAVPVPVPESAVVVIENVGELTTTSRPIEGLVGDDETRSSSCGSNGANRLASIGLDNTVRIWDTDSGEMLATTQLPRLLMESSPQLCCSRYGHRLATSVDETISIWNLRSDSSLELVRSLNTGHSFIYSLCMNDDGSCIVSGHTEGYLCYWDVEAGAELWSHDVSNGTAVCAVDISFDSALIVSGGDKIVRLWSTETGDEICQLRGHSYCILSVQFNPDASRIASGSYDTTIRIWDVATRCQVMLLEGHSNAVPSLSYFCDGTRLASASYDKTVRVWDSESGVCLLVLRGHDDYIRSVSLSSDGSRIASGGYDDTVRIWDSVSGCEVMQLEGHFGGVSGVCYVPAVSDYLLK